jgi:hypothetical protein
MIPELLASGLIPLTTFISLSIFLSSHPQSPARLLFHNPPIALPIHQDEAIDGSREKDAFDIDEPVVRNDGTPIHPEKFWASMWKRKLWLLISLIPPFGVNIALLVLVSLQSQGDNRTKGIVESSFLLASHLVTVFISILSIKHQEVPSHWASTIHLATALFVQFLTISFLTLLPSTPLPDGQSSLLANFVQLDVFRLPPLSAYNVLQWLLPIVQFSPLLISILGLRRGPPRHLPVEIIYPPKIIESIPADSPVFDSQIPNVSEEVEVTIYEWLMFSYATPVVWKGHTSESLDLYYIPIVPVGLRQCLNVT